MSNDNPYSESLFRTTKYRHDFPIEGFENLEAARVWVLKFVRWYNNEHHHCPIKFVTPYNQRHAGEEDQILSARQRVYKAAEDRNPHRWSGEIRNVTKPAVVWQNPERLSVQPDEKLKEAA